MDTATFVPFEQTELTDGFWLDRYELNWRVSIENVRRRFEDSGRFDAMRFNFLKNGRRPHIFFDSDVAKWMEAVAYLAVKDPEGMQEHLALCEQLHGGGTAPGRLSELHPSAADAGTDLPGAGKP